jgi:hypothetical protein
MHSKDRPGHKAGHAAKENNMADELTPEMLDTLDQLEAVYQTVRDAFHDLDSNDSFENPNQREQMAESVKIALMNWVRAKNRILGESNATVTKLSNTAKKAQDDIDAALKDLQSIKKTLNTITKVVNTVSSVVAMLT